MKRNIVLYIAFLVGFCESLHAAKTAGQRSKRCLIFDNAIDHTSQVAGATGLLKDFHIGKANENSDAKKNAIFQKANELRYLINSGQLDAQKRMSSKHFRNK